MECVFPTLEQYLKYWLSLRKADLALKTYSRYRGVAHHQIFPYIGRLDLRDVTPARIERLYIELLGTGGAKGEPLRSGSVSQVHRLLHVCFERAIADGLLERNPIDGVKAPLIVWVRRDAAAF